MRPTARLLGPALALLAAACADGTTTPNDMPDAGAGPDLAPVCLPAEPAEPAPPDPNCPIRRPAAPDTFDELLTRAGLDRCTLAYTASHWGSFGAAARRKDPFRLPWYDAAHDFPVNAPPFARALLARLDAAAKSDTPVAGMLAAMGSRLGAPVAPCIAPLVPDETAPLARAVADLITAAGSTPDEAALAEDARDIPLDLQRALAEVVLAARDADADFRAATAGLTEDQLGWLYGTGNLMAGNPNALDLTDTTVRDTLVAFDLHALAEGAVRLAHRVERAALPRFAGARGFSFDQPTPLGRVVLRDAADDTYEDGDANTAILLLVDTGGADTYRRAVGAVGSETSPHHVAIAIDLAGKDTWGYPEIGSRFDGKRLPADVDGRATPQPGGNGPIALSDTPRQGGARLGYGFVFDYGADADHYRSLRMSQGFGIAGVGVLFDGGGDDTYEGEAAVQGGATFGLGLLLDAGGDDTYRTYTTSQGFAFVRGGGLLYDAAGADQYLADIGDPGVGGDPLYFTPQLPGKGNSSFVQGAGYGRRAPGDVGAGDRVFMSGGLGVLRDGGGDDRYTASVFGQATGYWFGTGLLADAAGNDRYDGKWYVQGSAAHAALALFLDDAGDDRYNQTFPASPPAATSIGVGHDYSVSWHLDGGGDDLYAAPGLSLGSGHANGMGILLNLGGRDTYKAAGEPMLGGASIGDADPLVSRHAVPTVGLFLDTGGPNTFDAANSPVKRADDTAWTDNLQDNTGGYNNHGAGLQKPTGTVSLP